MTLKWESSLIFDDGNDRIDATLFTSCGDDDDDDDSPSQKNEVINVNGKDYETTFFMTQEGFSIQTTTKANSLLPISPRKVAQRRCISSHSVLIQNLNLKLVMISLKRTLDYLSRLVIFWWIWRFTGRGSLGWDCLYRRKRKNCRHRQEQGKDDH